MDKIELDSAALFIVPEVYLNMAMNFDFCHHLPNTCTLKNVLKKLLKGLSWRNFYKLFIFCCYLILFVCLFEVEDAATEKCFVV